MKKMKVFRALVALLLAAMMVLPSAVTMADPDPNRSGVEVYDGVAKAYDPDDRDWEEIGTTKLEGDLTVQNGMPSVIDVQSKNADSSFEVTGSVSGKLEEAHAASSGISTQTDPGRTTKVEVGGNVASECSEYGTAGAYGIRVDYNHGKTDVHVAGNVEAAASSEHEATATAVYAYTSTDQNAGNGEENKASAVTNVDVDGKAIAAATTINNEDKCAFENAVMAIAYNEGAETNVTVGKGAEGQVMAEAKDGGTVTVEILDGGVQADSPKKYERIPGAAVGTNNTEGTIGISVTGDVAAEGGRAIDSWNYGGSTTIDVTGDVSSANAGGAVYMFTTGKEAETSLTIDGNVSATGQESLDAVTLSVVSEGHVTATITGETITATVAGTTDGERDAAGLHLVNMGGDLDVVAVADITATGAEHSYGVNMISNPVSEDEHVDKDAEPVSGDDLVKYETYAIDGEKYDVYEDEAGNKYAEINGKFYPVVLKKVYDEGSINLTVTGNVSGDEGGLFVNVAEEQKTNIVIDGTVKGETAGGIMLSEKTELGENLTMTVWEVVPNKDKAVVVREEKDEEGNTVYTEDREAEKLIQYIIRIEDSSRSYIATAGTRDFAAGNGETYQVANQGDKVLVKLSIPDGKELVGAYWDVAQSEKGKLLKDSEGNYYLEVPRGGGVQLSLVMKDVPQPAPQPQPQPEPEPVPPRPDNYATLKFFEDRDSGPWTVVKAKGQPYRLPTPTREGQTFVGWAEGMIEPTNPNWREPAEGELCIIPGGTEYIVMGDRCFVGIWR